MNIEIKAVIGRSLMIRIALSGLFLHAPGWILSASAQSPDPSPSSSQLQAMNLEPKALELESFGLRLYLPAGTLVSAARLNQSESYILSDGSDLNAWSWRIAEIVSSLQNPTAAALVNEHLELQRRAGRELRVLSNSPATYGGVTGQLCFLEQIDETGQMLVNGWLIMPNGSRTFLVFTMVIRGENYSQFRPQLESSLQTIRITTREQRIADEQSRLQRGKAFLASLTPERLRKLKGTDQWLRAYRPADPLRDTPEQELGCSHIQIYEAKKGELNPDRTEERYDPSEHQLGLMIRVHGRVPTDPKRGLYFNWLGLYWLAWDQSEEAWSILGTQRRGEHSQTSAETGIRPGPTPGQPRPLIQVVNSEAKHFTGEPYQWPLPDVYLSQALSWCMGQLLPRDGQEELELAYYFYNNLSQNQPRLSPRIDRWKPAPDQSGNWMLTTQLATDELTFTTIFDRKGNMVKRIRPDGSMTVPTSTNALRRIWKARGLEWGNAGAGSGAR